MFQKIGEKCLTAVHPILIFVICVMLVAVKVNLVSFELGFTIIFVAIGIDLIICHALERRYRPFLFQPLKRTQFSKPALRFFDDQMQLLQSIGFTELGDYLMLKPPGSLRSRFAISAGGKCLAEFVERDGGVLNFSLISILDNGTYCESSSLKFHVSPSGCDQLQFRFVNGLTLMEALAHHQQWIRAEESEHGVEALETTAADFREWIEYGHRLAGHDRYQQGLIPAPPEPRKKHTDESEMSFVANRQVETV